MSSSTASPSIWWNCGRVGGVGVGTVDASGDHHVERRRVGLHRAHLHRRGVSAQDRLRRDIEGVGARPRGMRRAVVERVEVVVDGLDLGALHDREAEPEEDVLELAPRRRQHVQPADRLRRRAGQRHVDGVLAQTGLELAAGELPGARLDQRLERLARLVCRLADGRPLLGRQRGDLAQHPRQLRLAPEVAHPQLLELRAGGRGGDRPLGLLAQLLDPFGHDAGTLDGRRVISYSATVAAIAAFRDSEAIGMWATWLAGGERRPPAAPPARRRRAASAPRRRDRRRPAAASPARRRRARSARPGSSLIDEPTRASGDGEDRPHARPHRLRASAGPRSWVRARRTRRRTRGRSAARCRRCRGRRRRAGRGTAGLRAPPPSAARRRRARVCPSRASRPPASAARSTSWKSLAAEPRARHAVALERRRALPARPPRSGPRPRRGTCPRGPARACVCRRRSAFRRGLWVEAMAVMSAWGCKWWR